MSIQVYSLRVAFESRLEFHYYIIKNGRAITGNDLRDGFDTRDAANDAATLRIEELKGLGF